MFSPAIHSLLLFVILIVLQHSISSFGHGSEDSHRFRRVINNQYAEQHSRPWMVELKRDGVHICGAAVIMPPPNQFNVVKNGSSDILLTAAHCAITSTPHNFFTQYNMNPERITAHFGKHNSTGSEPWETVIRVSHVLIHPRYKRLNDSYDIAIVKLERAVEFDEKIQPIPLSPYPLDMVSDCSIAG